MIGITEYWFIFNFLIMAAAVLFLFFMIYRIVRAVERIAKTYAEKNSPQNKKEQNTIS